MTLTMTIRNQNTSIHQGDVKIKQGVPWLPVRAVLEGLGGEVQWDPISESITLRLGDDRIRVRPDHQLAISNGTTVALLSAPEVHDGVTYMTWFDLATYLPIEVELTCSPLNRPQPLTGQSLCLDPGHGGSEPGAQGPTGLLEKDINLAVALKLSEQLRQAGARVVMTRERDQTVSLSERSQLANRERVGWFVSVHCNSFTDRSANGTETFHYPTDGVGRRLAEGVQGQLVKSLGRYNRGVKSANFHVIRESTMPAILVELAFISNPEEEKLLADPQFQERAAQAIYHGILNTIAQA